MAEARDYYEVLGIARDADAAAIKDAFRELALKYHPDRNKESGASDRFKEIAEAYAVLSDPRKRAEYDIRGHAGVAGFSPEDLFEGIDFENIFGDIGLDRDGAGLFERLFHRRGRRRRGEDIEVRVVVPLARVLEGGEETVRVSRPETCAACQGSGAKAGTQPRSCTACGGTGRIVRQQRRQGVSIQHVTNCSACGGRGTIVDTPCPACGGSGRTLREETLAVRIPVGCEEGTTLRIPGHGLPADAPGLPAGDLLVVIRTAPDPRFQRHGRDLYRVDTVELVDAVLGTEIEVPTLDGQVAVRVPPGTQPDFVLRLRGKGLPPFEGGPRGDLFVRLQVHIPEHLSEQERRLFEQLQMLARPKPGGRT